YRSLPIVATLHGWTSQKSFHKLAFYQWLDALVIRRMDAVVLVNPLMHKHHAIVPISEDKIKVVVNGISQGNSDGVREYHEKLVSWKGEGILIGSIGRLSPENGYLMLLSAFAKLRDEHGYKNTKLVI